MVNIHGSISLFLVFGFLWFFSLGCLGVWERMHDQVKPKAEVATSLGRHSKAIAKVSGPLSD